MKQILPALSVVGAVLVLAGAVVFITRWPYAPHIFLIGATLVALAQINLPSSGKSRNVRRLRRQQMLGALLLVASGVLLVLGRVSEWILCMTIAAVFELYTSFRIPQEEAKEQR